MALTNGLQLLYGIQPLNALPVDAWSGPYNGVTEAAAIAAANAAILPGARFVSLGVRLIINGTPKWYWYRDGISDSNLVEYHSKTDPSTVSYLNTEFLKISGGTVTGDSGFTKNVTISGTLSSSDVAYFKDAFFYSGTALALSGVFYGDGRRLLGSAFDQDIVNSWVRSNSSISTGYNTLSSNTIFSNFVGTTLFKTQSAVTISTNTAAGSATFHGVYYGNGWELEGVDKTQPVINSWVRSNSSIATGYNTLSSKTVYGDFIGTTLFKTQSAVTISTNTAAGSSTFHGVYYGDGWNLEGVDRSQPTINSWVRSNSSISTGYNTLSSKTVYGDFFGTQLFKTVSATEITTNVTLGSATHHGIFYGDGRRLLGSAFDQDVVNSWVRSNSSVATGYNTLSSKTVYGDFVGTQLFKTVSAVEISTNVALGSATVHGIFYGDGRRLLGSAFDQDVVNSWVRSNSSISTGYNTLSSNTIFSNFVGTQLFKTVSAAEISTNVALGSATHHGIFYGDGRRLLGSAFDQDVVNSWVRSNSSIAIGYNTLSSNTIYGDFVGTQLFKTDNSTEISTNVALGSATVHGVFYGDGRRLLGSAFDQDIVNSFVRSNSSISTGYNTLSSNTLYGNYFGTPLFKAASATVVATNTVLGSATHHGVYYGDGTFLDNVTVGNKRFEYIGPVGPYPAYSFSGTTRSIYTTTSEPYWKIVRVEYDTDGAVLGLSSTTGVSWINRASEFYYPF